MHHRERLSVREARRPQSESNVRPFRGFLPFNVLPTARSHIPPAGTTPNRLRCAPRVSHPLDALLPTRPAELISSRFRSWALPFEASILALRRTPSRAPFPSRASTRIRRSGLTPQGFTHHAKPYRRSRGLVGMPRRLPPWASCPSKVSCLMQWVYA